MTDLRYDPGDEPADGVDALPHGLTVAGLERVARRAARAYPWTFPRFAERVDLARFAMVERRNCNGRRRLWRFTAATGQRRQIDRGSAEWLAWLGFPCGGGGRAAEGSARLSHPR